VPVTSVSVLRRGRNMRFVCFWTTAARSGSVPTGTTRIRHASAEEVGKVHHASGPFEVVRNSTDAPPIAAASRLTAREPSLLRHSEFILGRVCYMHGCPFM
jgi:hypothetical protein